MTVMTFIGLAAGLALLVAGADGLVRGAGGIAKKLGVPSLIIGLTVVAYGTSAPEVAVSVSGAAGGEPGVALGNVLGSTVANILLILGISALIGGLVVARRLIQIETPLMIGIAAVVWLFALGGGISALEGVLLVAIAVVYTVLTVRSARSGKNLPPVETEAVEAKPRPIAINVLFVLVGLAALVIGSEFLVNSAVDIAAELGLSDVIIGLTVVAVGTSLPEIATSIAAAIKGDRDMAVGNVIGSNIFNLTLVLGLSGVVAPNGLPVPQSVLNFDFPVMLAACFACLPIFFTGHAVRRWEGAVFVAYYVAYVTYLVLDANDHASAGLFGSAMVVFVIPLTALTIGVLFSRELHERVQRRRERGPVTPSK